MQYNQSKLQGDWIVTIRSDNRLRPRFTDHLIVPDLSTLTIVIIIKFLLLWMIVIEISLYCCDKYTNFGTNTHNPELYLLSFGHFLFSLEFKKVAK